MSGAWRYTLHQETDEFVQSLRKAERRDIRIALDHLLKYPFQRPHAEVRPRNDRIYSIKTAARFRIHYWLDLPVREVVIVRIERW